MANGVLMVLILLGKTGFIFSKIAIAIQPKTG